MWRGRAGLQALAGMRQDRHMDTHRALPALPAAPARQWDVFCQVIDNLGDIGVCWRLCADLVTRGQSVRLWIDRPEALTWMAPGALEGSVQGLQVLKWTRPLAPELVKGLPPGDVWVEAFGCDPAPECIAHLAQRIAAGAHAPTWINLEYLSAEAYVERSHRLPSPVMSGPLKGLSKQFYFPGFTPATGGLLREPGLLEQQADFEAARWLLAHGLPADAQRRVSLFCYEPPALQAVLGGAGEDSTPSHWLVTPGRAKAAVSRVQDAPVRAAPSHRLHDLPYLTQRDFDHLLWSCDLNFVRGEDSMVRALWAGKPFVWHIYPQHDNAHEAKLEAFLDWMQAPESLRRFHQVWNGVSSDGNAWPGWTVIDGWRACVLAARQRLLVQPDLTSQLLSLLQEKH